MIIEDNDLVFTSGKRIPIDCGVIGLTPEGAITEGFTDQALHHELDDQEKWELARFMVNRWMDYRDQLWAKHEKVLDGLTGIVDEPHCPDTTCFENDADYKDGCALTNIERDKCKSWKDLVKANKKDMSPGEAALQESIDKIKSEEIIYSDTEAKHLLNALVDCPDCGKDTLIGMYKEATNRWRVVEPRYCPICSWKDEPKKEALRCPDKTCPYIDRTKEDQSCGLANLDECGRRLNYINGKKLEKLREGQNESGKPSKGHSRGTPTGFGQER